MSADDFARLQSELNPAGTAFTERLQAAEREFAALQAVEKELKTDEAKFSAHLQALRQSLETNSRSLSAVHAKRARLAKELAACDEEIGRLDAEKAEVSARMHKATSRAAGNREKKLRALDSSHGGAGSKGGGGSSPPVADLLGEPPTPSAAPPTDLLGDDLMSLGPAQPSNPLDLLAGLGAPPAVAPAARPAPRVAPAARAAPSMPPSACADGFEDSFGGFDVSDVAGGSSAPGSGVGSRASNPFDQPPKGMMMGSMAPNAFGARQPTPSMQPGLMTGSRQLSGGLGAKQPAAAPSADPFAGLAGLGKS